MIEVKQLGHAAFVADDVDELATYYRDVIGLTVTEQDKDGATYLTSGLDHQTVAIYPGAGRGLAHIGLKLSPGASLEEAARSLKDGGVESALKSDAEPGIGELLEFDDIEGNTIQLYTDIAASDAGFSGVGIEPQKLGHICIRAQDVTRLADWYQEQLGFRWSDWIGDFFVFIRCNSDHHTLNLLKGPKSGNELHHIAYELRDWGHVQPACDHLYRSGYKLAWGPGRHGPGHNIYTYHQDAHGHMVELFTQLDVIADEAVGSFEPRPWHEDHPQRPKVWVPDPLAPNRWGITPPEGFM